MLYTHNNSSSALTNFFRYSVEINLKPYSVHIIDINIGVCICAVFMLMLIIDLDHILLSMRFAFRNWLLN